jgi:hypothetical protein
MLPSQSIFHLPEQMEARMGQIRTTLWVWWDSSVKLCNVLRGLQTGMRPPLSCCRKRLSFLWPDSANSGLQLSQRRDIAGRVDGLSAFEEIKEDYTDRGALHFMSWQLCKAFRNVLTSTVWTQ